MSELLRRRGSRQALPGARGLFGARRGRGARRRRRELRRRRAARRSALVGESGCGKSTTGRRVLRLIEPTAGRVLLRRRATSARSTRGELRAARRGMQIVFQDPFASLNPRMTVGEIAGASRSRIHGLARRAGAAQRVAELLEQVGLRARARAALPARVLRRPAPAHRHRARARAWSRASSSATSRSRRSTSRSRRRSSTCCRTCSSELGLAYLFIAHDLAVVQAHRRPRGRDVPRPHRRDRADERGSSRAPRHPYTQALLSAVPVPDPGSAPRPHRAAGRRAEPDRSAAGLPLPRAVRTRASAAPRGSRRSRPRAATV